MRNKEIEIIKVIKSNTFVGIKIEDNKVKVFIPVLLRISEDKKEKTKDILLFLKSISLARTKVKEQIESKIIDEQEYYWPIDSYVWLILDFLENGLFYNYNINYYNSGKGKINWKKTLKKKPIISDTNIVYTEVVCSRISQTSDIISEIYCYCLNIAKERIGWLFCFDTIEKCNLVFSIKEMIDLIQRELKMTFDELKSIRFRHMLQILKNVNKSNFGKHYSSYGINNYYYVYEKMIDIAFGNVINKSNYYPRGVWHFENKTISAHALIPDTIMIKNNFVYIIDAKMYRYAISYDNYLLPSTQSIQKQITYGDYLSNVKQIQNIRNIFILPMNKMKIGNDKQNNMVYIGYATGDWRNSINMKEYDYIFTFLIDLNFLLKNYRNNLKSSADWMCDRISILLKSIDL